MGLLLLHCLAGCNGDEDSLVEVNFQIQNEDGIECYDFTEGDNIVFKLEFKNNTGETIIVRPFKEIIGFDAFHIYSVNGDDMGTPWDQMYGTLRGADIIEARSSVAIVCPWFDVPALALNGHEHFYSDCFYKTEEKSPLPKGEYYSKFDIELENKTITCKRAFKIH